MPKGMLEKEPHTIVKERDRIPVRLGCNLPITAWPPLATRALLHNDLAPWRLQQILEVFNRARTFTDCILRCVFVKLTYHPSCERKSDPRKEVKNLY
jgi:hypothetical protein